MSNSCLSSLDLSSCGIVDADLIALGAVLKHNKALRWLNISACWAATDRGCSALFRGLAGNTVLQELIWCEPRLVEPPLASLTRCGSFVGGDDVAVFSC